MALRPESFAFTVLLAGMAALPALSIDMSLPAIPLLVRGFHTNPGVAGLTLSLFMAGFAAAQLVFGPLSDRFGRRPALLGGVGLYAIAGLCCALAPSVALLNAFRLLQGTGAAAGMAMSLAIVRDVFKGAQARVKLSYVAVVLGIAPVVAPTLGAVVVQVASWRVIFALHACAGLVLCGAIAFGLRETRPADTSRAGVFVLYLRVLRTRRAIGHALANAFSFGNMFAYVSGSPLLFMGTLGVSTAMYGLLFACTAASITLGSWLNGRLSERGVSQHRLLGAGLYVGIACVLGLLGVAVGGRVSLGALMPLFVINMFCRGLIGPNATHGAVEPMPQAAGVAAAVTGFLQMLLGAVASAIVAALYPSLHALSICATMTVTALLAFLAWQFALGGKRARTPASDIGRIRGGG